MIPPCSRVLLQTQSYLAVERQNNGRLTLCAYYQRHRNGQETANSSSVSRLYQNQFSRFILTNGIKHSISCWRYKQLRRSLSAGRNASRMYYHNRVHGDACSCLVCLSYVTLFWKTIHLGTLDNFLFYSYNEALSGCLPCMKIFDDTLKHSKDKANLLSNTL